MDDYNNYNVYDASEHLFDDMPADLFGDAPVPDADPQPAYSVEEAMSFESPAGQPAFEADPQPYYDESAQSSYYDESVYRPAGRAESREDKAARRARSGYDRHNAVLALVFFAIAILFVVINLFSPDKDYSTSENRSLQQRPSLSWSTLKDGSWFTQTADWYADQFFARDGWISMKVGFDRLVGHKQSGDIYIGSDGYLQRAPYEPDTDAELNTAQAINTFAQAYPDLNFTMAVVPDSAAVQPQYLPDNAPVRDQKQDIAAFTGMLDSSIGQVDAAQALQMHYQEYIYYKTDHHWTTMGAYYAFLSTASQMGIEAQTTYDIYTLSNSFEGTLASESGCHRADDVITLYAPMDDSISYYVYNPDTGENTTSVYVSAKLDEKDQYTVFFGGNYGMLQIHTTADTGRTLLVFKDSYANCFVPFLIPYFDEIIMVDSRYYYDNLSSLMMSEGVTDVLFLYSADMLLTDTVLAGVLETGLPQQADEDASIAAAIEENGEAADTDTAEETGAETTEDTGETADETADEAAETADSGGEEALG